MEQINHKLAVWKHEHIVLLDDIIETVHGDLKDQFTAITKTYSSLNPVSMEIVWDFGCFFWFNVCCLNSFTRNFFCLVVVVRSVDHPDNLSVIYEKMSRCLVFGVWFFNSLCTIDNIQVFAGVPKMFCHCPLKMTNVRILLFNDCISDRTANLLHSVSIFSLTLRPLNRPLSGILYQCICLNLKSFWPFETWRDITFFFLVLLSDAFCESLNLKRWANLCNSF